MVENDTSLLRRGLLVAGLALTAWSVLRVVLLLSGNEAVISDDDRHGYLAIFSLVLLPVLAAAAVTLVTATREVWRHGRWRIGPGVALVLSAPLASPLALASVLVGVTILVVVALDRRQSALAKNSLR
ncbi:hypothetical protein [Amycolatopsis albispora]|uniref:Uncharacterized protein n=1 Tax=Amycolatopsis albispora TaxID=1804986 RepID=A0A344L0X8_9PSEU|nr:hypothetical protein [Amycolatopsis albispora]AXB41702.1 hypothetical protein A4R43_03525 [Amycolatopsis albispora]